MDPWTTGKARTVMRGTSLPAAGNVKGSQDPSRSSKWSTRAGWIPQATASSRARPSPKATSSRSSRTQVRDARSIRLAFAGRRAGHERTKIEMFLAAQDRTVLEERTAPPPERAAHELAPTEGHLVSAGPGEAREFPRDSVAPELDVDAK